jgi:uncharacterized membrane protein required for colicin V production
VTKWPNWVDLLIVTLVFKACYNGFVRGIATEALHLIGVVSLTVLTLNYGGVVATWLMPWVSWPPSLVALIGFWGLFAMLWLTMRLVIRRVTELLKWERVHWVIQGVGLFLGGLRGLWWTGFLLVVFISSGLPFLVTSVEQGSVLGPGLLKAARTTVVQVADRFPGAQRRGAVPVPPLQPKGR